MTAVHPNYGERLVRDPRNSATVSRIIKDALEERVIKPFEEGQAKKAARYLP